MVCFPECHRFRHRLCETAFPPCRPKIVADSPEFELRAAQYDLEASRNRYTELFDLAPVGYLHLNGKGFMLDLNLTASGSLNSKPDQAAVTLDRHQVEYSVGAQLDWPLDRVAERNQYRITVAPEIATRARLAIERMVAIGGNAKQPLSPADGIDPGE